MTLLKLQDLSFVLAIAYLLQDFVPNSPKVKPPSVRHFIISKKKGSEMENEDPRSQESVVLHKEGPLKHQLIFPSISKLYSPYINSDFSASNKK